MDYTSDRAQDALDMMTVADRLNDERVAEYFRGNDHRIAACRAMISLLDLPCPDWARRSLSGRAAVHKAAINRFKADHPQERILR